MPSTTDERRVSEPDLEAREADSDLEIDAQDRDSVSAVFGSNRRSGAWPVPDHIRARAYFGDVTFDFREAILPASDVVEVHGTAVFGSIKLIVPKGAELEIEPGSVVFGSVGHNTGWARFRSFYRRWLFGEEEEEPDPDYEGVVFRVTGTAIFGDISVVTR